MENSKVDFLKLYNGCILENDEKSVKCIMKLILKQKLHGEEYVKLYENGDDLLKTAIILKAPIEVLKVILMHDDGFYLSNALGKRMQKDKELQELVNAVYAVRKCVIKYVDNEKLVERLLIEEDKGIVKHILKILNDYTFTKEEIDNLLNAKSSYVRGHFIQYVTPKEKLVEYLLVEQDKEVLAKSIYFLDDYKISSDIANKLMDSYYFMVREYAAKYATKSKLIEILKDENTLDVISVILNRLENYKISEREAKSLMVNSNAEVKKFAIKHISEEELAKLLSNSAKINNTGIVCAILENLQNYKLPCEQADKLLSSKHNEIRKFAAKYASENQLVSRLSVEKDECICEFIIKRLENYKFTEKQANHLLYSDSFSVVTYVLKFVSRDKLITYLLNPKIKVDDDFIKLLDELKFTMKESEKLINSKSYKIRIYFTKFVSEEKLFEKLMIEPKEEVIISIIENL